MFDIYLVVVFCCERKVFSNALLSTIYEASTVCEVMYILYCISFSKAQVLQIFEYLYMILVK